MLDIQTRIDRMKLNFYHHILNMKETSLAKIFAKIQLKNNFPGLMKDCVKLLHKYKIYNHNVENLTKVAWKNIVRKATKNKFVEDTLDSIKNYKKIKYEDKVQETFETKDYIMKYKLKEARMKFAIETEMVEGIKFNYMNDRNNEECL